MNRLPQFDRIAPFYDRLARMVYGNQIFLAQTDSLKQIANCNRALILGGGTGWWLPEFRRNNPQCLIYFVEASQRMIALAKAKMPDDSLIHFVHGSDATLHKLPFQFDAVVTFFLFDLFASEEVSLMCQRIDRSIVEGGLWLVADFVNKKWWHRGLLKAMYTFFHLISAVSVNKLPEWEAKTSALAEQVWGQYYCLGFVRSMVLRKQAILPQYLEPSFTAPNT